MKKSEEEIVIEKGPEEGETAPLLGQSYSDE